MKKLLGLIVLAIALIGASVFGISTARAEENLVPWSFYSNGGHLVINGINEEYGSEPTSTGTIDINAQHYPSTSPTVPWHNYPVGSLNIRTVEFAKETRPKSMSYWFDFCQNINKFDSTNLITSDVTSMQSTFEMCFYINSTTISSLAEWDVSNVTNMTGMFENCQSINDISFLKGWDVSSVTNMASMFENCYSLSDLSPLTKWDVSHVNNMSLMFKGCKLLSDLLPLSGWTVSNVKNMNAMFSNESKLSNLLPLSEWDTSNVEYMGSMFEDCTSLKTLSGLEKWNTSNVSTFGGTGYDVQGMFNGCSKLTDISAIKNWDISSATRLIGVFGNCTSLAIADLDDWHPHENADVTRMFYGCTSLETIYCQNSWNVEYNANMFDQSKKLTSKTSGKTYNDGYGSAMANPITGLFTMPLEVDSTIDYAPRIQKKVISADGEVINDWDFKNKPFTFVISSDTGAPLPSNTTAKTNEYGDVIWPEIEYDEPGEYIYQVQEQVGNYDNIKYDTTIHELKVKVESSISSQ